MASRINPVNIAAARRVAPAFVVSKMKAVDHPGEREQMLPGFPDGVRRVGVAGSCPHVPNNTASVVVDGVPQLGQHTPKVAREK